jgi:hypothetical protein
VAYTPATAESTAGDEFAVERQRRNRTAWWLLARAVSDGLDRLLLALRILNLRGDPIDLLSDFPRRETTAAGLKRIDVLLVAR